MGSTRGFGGFEGRTAPGWSPACVPEAACTQSHKDPCLLRAFLCCGGCSVHEYGGQKAAGMTPSWYGTGRAKSPVLPSTQQRAPSRLSSVRLLHPPASRSVPGSPPKQSTHIQIFVSRSASSESQSLTS